MLVAMPLVNWLPLLLANASTYFYSSNSFSQGQGWRMMCWTVQLKSHFFCRGNRYIDLSRIICPRKRASRPSKYKVEREEVARLMHSTHLKRKKKGYVGT